MFGAGAGGGAGGGGVGVVEWRSLTGVFFYSPTMPIKCTFLQCFSIGIHLYLTGCREK